MRAAHASEVIVARVPPGTHVNELPLPFSYWGVTGAYVHFDASRVREYDGDDKDLITVDIVGQGPVKFSFPRWNQGDFAPRMAPLHPYRQPNLAVTAGYVGYRTDDPADLPAQVSILESPMTCLSAP